MPPAHWGLGRTHEGAPSLTGRTGVANEGARLPQGARERLLDPGRLEVLRRLGLFGGPEDGDLDRLSRLAAGLLATSAAAVVLVDADGEWCAGGTGLAERSQPMGLAARVVASGAAFLVDTAGPAPDSRFVSGIGVPILVDGQRVGALLGLDADIIAPPEPSRLAQIKDLAAMATALIELKRDARVRAATAAELIREEWRHALTLEAGHIGSWVWDVPSGAITCNDIFRRMFRLDPVAPIHVEALFVSIQPEFLPEVEDGLARTFEDGVDFAAEFRVATERWLSARGRVYQRNAEGRPLVMMGIAIDITEAREAADHTRHLLLELNHRVKNTLAMTQSIARQTLRQSPDPQVFIDTFSGRIRTLADAHELLADRDWAGIGLADLVQSQVMPYVPLGSERLQVAGEDMQLPPDQALGLGIVLHELASNAARYGALSPAGGRVRIYWTSQDGRLRLDWRESGGPPVTAQPARGFGSRLIERSLDKVLGSSVRLEMPTGGVVAQVVLPLADQSGL